MKYIFFLFAVICVFFFVCWFAAILKRKELFTVPYNIEWTNCIKGAAIILVICGHLGNLFGVRYLNPFGAIGVACFLIMSGYGSSASFEKRGLKGFWIKKLSIYIPYVVIELIGYFTYWKPSSVLDVILDLLLIHPLHPFGWYMQFLAIWYIVFFVSKLVNNRYWRVAFPVLAACIAFIISERNLVAENAFSFAAGMLLFHYRKTLFQKMEKLCFLLCSFVHYNTIKKIK